MQKKDYSIVFLIYNDAMIYKFVLYQIFWGSCINKTTQCPISKTILQIVVDECTFK